MIRPAALFLLPLVFLTACETTEITKPRYLSSVRNLQEEPGGVGNKALVRQSDPSTLKRYNRVVVEKVRVIQPKSAPESKSRATSEEAKHLASRFEQILREELSPHYQITNRRGANTLVVRATLTDLQASNPGVFVFNYLPYAAAVTTGVSLATGKTPGAGSTTVEAEVLDAYSRRQVYAIVDQFKGSKFQPAGVERWGQTEAAMRTWSRKIRAGIQGASPTPAASPGRGRTSSTARTMTGTSKKASATTSTRKDPGKTTRTKSSASVKGGSQKTGSSANAPRHPLYSPPATAGSAIKGRKS